MDHGFTEHSGCPVFEGHKSIVTQWIRLGVDDGKPWDSFNTLGFHESIFKEGNSMYLLRVTAAAAILSQIRGVMMKIMMNCSSNYLNSKLM